MPVHSNPLSRYKEERMGTPRFTPEFKEEAVRQITERGYSVAEVSDRLGVSGTGREENVKLKHSRRQ